VSAFIELVRKDIALQFRSRDAFLVVLLFSLLVLLVFAFAFGPMFAPVELDALARQREVAKLASSAFWIAVAFSGVIALHRSAELDREHGALKAVRLTGIAPETLYWARVASMVILLLFMEALLTPLTIAFLQVDAFRPGDAVRLAMVAGVGTLGFSALGAFAATMTTSARGRESILSVLLLPLVVPLLIAATKSTVPVFASQPLDDVRWVVFLAGYALLTLGLCTVLYPAILEE
jgi:heme exporter protein B